MSPQESPATRREKIIGKWLDAVFATYPFETTGFMRTRMDQFGNPVGYATRRAAEVLYDAVCGADVDQEAVHSALEAFIKVRAVQDFRPDQAVGTLFLIKPILREFFLVDALAAGTFQDYLEMESRVDTLALMAFNFYVADREVVFTERVTEQRRATAHLKRWAEQHGFAVSEDSGKDS